MQFKLLCALAFSGAVLASSVLEERQAGFCPEAGRFGFLTLSPSTVSPGQSFNIQGNYSCSYLKGIRPEFLDYYVEVPVGNNGHEPPIQLARRVFEPAKGAVDSFMTELPHGFYFANANYTVTVRLTYPVAGTDGSKVYFVGQTNAALKITDIE